jgi:exosortase
MSPIEQVLAAEIKTTPGQTAKSSRAYWVGALALCAILGILYHRILPALVQDWWRDPNFSHGFFVPLFSAYVIWRDRRNLVKVPIRPSWFGIIVVGGGLSILVAGSLGAEMFLSRSSLILILAGLVVLFLGWAYLRALLFPLLFLFLMVPIPAIIFNQITFPLQLLASRLASIVLPGFGVPVLREGNVINLPAMPLEVAEACSGIRSLMSLLTLAAIYSYFIERSSWKRGCLVAVAVPIAVAANAARIIGTGLLVQYWDPDKALGFFHEFSGWIIFLVSVFLLIAAQSVLHLFGRPSHGGTCDPS